MAVCGPVDGHPLKKVVFICMDIYRKRYFYLFMVLPVLYVYIYIYTHTYIHTYIYKYLYVFIVAWYIYIHTHTTPIYWEKRWSLATWGTDIMTSPGCEMVRAIQKIYVPTIWLYCFRFLYTCMYSISTYISMYTSIYFYIFLHVILYSP